MTRTTIAAITIALSVPIGIAQAADNDDAMASSTMSHGQTMGNSMSHDAAGNMMSDNSMSHNAMSANDMSDNGMSGNGMSGNGMSGGMAGGYQPQTTDDGIKYVIGGVGNESQAQMKQHADEYSLHVMTVSGKAYVSGADVMITDEDGDKVLDTPVDGAMLYVALEPGSYTVKGLLNDAKASQKVTIGDDASETVRLNFPKSDK